MSSGKDERRKLARQRTKAENARKSSAKHNGNGRAADAKSDLEMQASDVNKSMLITHDRRYEEIEHFKNVGSARLDRIVGADGSPNKLYPEQWNFPEPIGTRAALTRVKPPVGVGEGSADPSEVGPPPEDPEPLQLNHQEEIEALAFRETHAASSSNVAEKFAGRVQWEESFRSNVKKLTGGFDLTRDPGCRLHHLDRLHNWFTKEGKKQTRKEKPAPNFLTFENHMSPLPGSARSIAPPSSTATVNLACTLQMHKRCPRIHPHLSVVPPPPPQPGYK